MKPSNSQGASGSGRRVAQASSVPLGLMAATFFLPFVDHCGTGKFQSPLAFVIEGGDVSHGLWVLPPFAGALLLALGTWMALVRGGFPGRGMRALAAVVLLAGAAVNVAWVAGAIGVSTRFELGYGLWAGAATVLASVLWWWSRRTAGWQLWSAYIACHALLSSSLCWVVVSVSRMSQVGPGGWIHLACTLILIGQGYWLFDGRHPVEDG